MLELLVKINKKDNNKLQTA